jgi:hypothetical protein
VKANQPCLLGLLRPRCVAGGDDHRNIGFRRQFLSQRQTVATDEQTIHDNEIRTDTSKKTFRPLSRANHKAAMAFGAQRDTQHFGDIFVVFDQDDVGHLTFLNRAAGDLQLRSRSFTEKVGTSYIMDIGPSTNIEDQSICWRRRRLSPRVLR